MARGFYRFYLYIVFIAMCIFLVVTTSQLLNTLFLLTRLRAGYMTPPTQSEIIQSVVLAVVSWVIAGLVGGLHYWLIQRDIRQEPAAATSAIRAFFLNASVALGVLIGVPILGFGALADWATNSNYGAVWELAYSLPLLCMALLLQLECRRTPVAKGAAVVFQRIHIFGMQAILLLYLTVAFSQTIVPLIDSAFFANRGALDSCNIYASECSSQNLAGLLAMTFWFLLCWLIYGLFTRNDTSRGTRLVTHSLSLAFGVSYLVYGVFVLLTWLFSPIFHVSISFTNVISVNPTHNFSVPLAIGIVSGAVYSVLLLDIVQRKWITPYLLGMTEQSIAGIPLAVVFWVGVANGLYDLLEKVAATSWIVPLALLLTGLGYIPLDIYLRRRYAQNPTTAILPRRGFVLALLAGGILTLAIGGVLTLYTLGTALFGSAISNWSTTMHTGLAMTVVGALVTAIYLWTTLREQLLAGRVRINPRDPSPGSTLENIIDELLAGEVTRDEAVAQLHALTDLKPNFEQVEALA